MADGHRGVDRVATYRVQLSEDGGFDAVTALLPYLTGLGVSHVYLSPPFEAVAGSTHGYDVVDHTRVRRVLGGEEGIHRLFAAAAELGLGVVVDVVPNHMAVQTPDNPVWWQLLAEGPTSPAAHWFDVSWEGTTGAGPGRVLVPVLAEPYGVELGSGAVTLSLGPSGAEVRYAGHRFPVAAGSLDDLGGAHPTVVERVNADPELLDRVLERQHYRLAHWRMARDELDYRRFFDVDSLAALRVEDPAVFQVVHRLPLAWVEDGAVDGLRIDHVDGLRDPLDYLRSLRRAAPGTWLLVEKILTGDERLREEWPVDGTTGYEALAAIGTLFVDPPSETVLTDLAEEITGSRLPFDEVAREGKRLVLREVLASDVERVVELAASAVADHLVLRDATRQQLRATGRLSTAFIRRGAGASPRARGPGSVTSTVLNWRGTIPGNGTRPQGGST